MAELILEPYAVVQHWSLPGSDGRWEAVLAEYLETLAQRCSGSGRSVIGHIKALAVFPDEKYLLMSVVAAGRPATVEGAVPPGCTALDLTLNVLVYGLESSLIEQIVQETVRKVAKKWAAGIS